MRLPAPTRASMCPCLRCTQVHQPCTPPVALMEGIVRFAWRFVWASKPQRARAQKAAQQRGSEGQYEARAFWAGLMQTKWEGPSPSWNFLINLTTRHTLQSVEVIYCFRACIHAPMQPFSRSSSGPRLESGQEATFLGPLACHHLMTPVQITTQEAQAPDNAVTPMSSHKGMPHSPFVSAGCDLQLWGFLQAASFTNKPQVRRRLAQRSPVLSALHTWPDSYFGLASATRLSWVGTLLQWRP